MIYYGAPRGLHGPMGPPWDPHGALRGQQLEGAKLETIREQVSWFPGRHQGLLAQAPRPGAPKMFEWGIMGSCFLVSKEA